MCSSGAGHLPGKNYSTTHVRQVTSLYYHVTIATSAVEATDEGMSS